MKDIISATLRTACAVAACLLLPADIAAAQSTPTECTSSNTANASQTTRCEGVTIVAENGARFTLHDRDGNGRVDSVELSSKALLLDVTKRRGGRQFRVIAPQAIAAVRGTRWAVDTTESKTSVFVVDGSVTVSRNKAKDRAVNRVTLGAGEGVDVEATGPLTIKRWPAERVSALMARLGQ